MNDPRISVANEIVRLFNERESSAYGHEAVSQREHSLQMANFPRLAGASLDLAEGSAELIRKLSCEPLGE